MSTDIQPNMDIEDYMNKSNKNNKIVHNFIIDLIKSNIQTNEEHMTKLLFNYLD